MLFYVLSSFAIIALKLAAYFCCVLNVMLLLSFFDSSSRCQHCGLVYSM